MEIIHVPGDAAPGRLDTLDALPETGFVWLHWPRDHADGWNGAVERLTGARIDEQHVRDSLRTAHPSFQDGTPDYEMLILQGLAPESGAEHLVTRSVAFFLLPRLLVTVAEPDSRSIAGASRRLLDRIGRRPDSPAGLMHQVLSTMVDRFLEIREPQREVLDARQSALLDPARPEERDWSGLLSFRSEANRLTALCEEQIEAVEGWRAATGVEMDSPLQVRFNDLVEHIRRVASHADQLHHDVDAVIQLHFSAVAHRTNEVVRVLTVVSAIFLPLNLVAGLFGMNFEHMPWLAWAWGFPATIATMALAAAVLLVLFRRKGYF